MLRKTVVGHCALWFRSSDLRLDDHTALHAACHDAKSLLPVYVFDPLCFNALTRYGGARKSTARRARFLLECVASLRLRLEEHGSGLAVALGSPADIIPVLCADCEVVFVTEGFCSEEKLEEARVAWKLMHGGLKRVWGGTLYLPTELGGYDPDNVPLGHNQFRNNCRSKGRIRAPIPEPSRLPPLLQHDRIHSSAEVSKALKFLPTLQDLGYSDEDAEAAYVDDPRSAMVWEGGENAAWIRLQRWMFDHDRLKDYRDTQNGMLGEEYSSKLSPWIARGCISVRRIWSEVQRYESERSNNHSTYWFRNLLEWRDRMIYIARSQGDRIFKLAGIGGDQYSRTWHGTSDDLQVWKDGRTGEDLVDAGMKELALTGYMSMRARHIVASYLIYELGVDWRHGAAHFEEHLLDYDPALNWVMWMLQTGVMGPKSGRSLGLSHFDAKRPYASQRKTLANHVADRAYIQHWLTASSSLYQGRFHQRLSPVHPALAVRSGACASISTHHDDHDDPGKYQAPRKQFGEPALVQLSEGASKGKGKHRRWEHCDASLAGGTQKRRWGRKAETATHSELTLPGA
mmetsp:Transcript_83004/g.234818  ORF Transcript_83004/g.234818 Transcript_83004/m.234818 type:complete len:572 (+) Transcript_83004:100-1815(+)